MKVLTLAAALACLAAPAAAANVKKIGPWSVSQSTDAMTGAEKVVVLTFNGNAGLAFRCVDHERSAVLVLPRLAGALKPAPVSYKVDEGEIQSRRGDPFGQYDLELLNPEPLLADVMAGKSKVTLRFATADEVVRTESFQIRASRAALEKIAMCVPK